MFEPEDAHGVFLEREEHALITKGGRTGHVAVQWFDVPSAGAGVVEDGVEETHNGRRSRRRMSALALSRATRSNQRHYGSAGSLPA